MHRLYTLPSGKKVELWQDADPPDPREWDNLGTLVCFHRRYELGDKHKFSPESFREFMEEHEKAGDIYWLPVYMYDHSGITLSTGPFHDPWDSGQLGVIYVEHERVLKEWSVAEVSDELEKKVLEILEGEIKSYDQYLRGECWGYVLYSPEGEIIDSCGGFYGSDDPAENGIYDQIGERPNE